MDSVSRYCTWQPHSLVWQWSVKSQQRFLFFLWYGEEWRSGSAWDHVLTSSALSVSTGASLWPISSQCWKAVLHLSLVPVISCHPSCLFNQPLIFIWMAAVWLHCLSFPDMPLTTKCWCRPSQRCFLAHFSLLVLLSLNFSLQVEFPPLLLLIWCVTMSRPIQCVWTQRLQCLIEKSCNRIRRW